MKKYTKANRRTMADRHMRRSACWKAGESELICLHGDLRFHRIGRMAKNFRADFELFMGKKKISFPFK